MRTLLLIAILATATAGLVGCQGQMNFNMPGASTQPSELVVLRKQVRDLKEENSSLKSENSTAMVQIKDLQDRDKTLSAELLKLQFLSTQQARALEALKTLPEERDFYRKQAEELYQAAEDLLVELQKLRPDMPRRTLPKVTPPGSFVPATTKPAASAPGN